MVIILGDSSNSNKILSALLLNVIVVNVSFLNSDKTFMSSELFCLGCSLQKKKPNTHTHTQTKQNKPNTTKRNEKKATTQNKNQPKKPNQNTNKLKPVIVYFPVSVARGYLIIKV